MRTGKLLAGDWPRMSREELVATLIWRGEPTRQPGVIHDPSKRFRTDKHPPRLKYSEMAKLALATFAGGQE